MRYCYELQQSELVSVHRISRRQCKGFASEAARLLPWLLLVISAAFHLVELHSLALLLATSSTGLILRRRFLVTEEAVVLMPTLGIQLQTKYTSGKTRYSFIPTQKLLAAVINEAVTPFSCYFYLALVLHQEPALTLVFEASTGDATAHLE
ncbi:phosphatidylinositol N-acetylglucosaminyltransferase subunit H-like isoform X2 [Selaginella moellendorffii]|uniref:phosphatidylinositol N-acetylglucosaminyltransferase subunit H-like isoform X2 n=1 Tax=Selaginella moellendorffii TaxID=88036 RepID=UPI000D1D0E83|nr:phosphatidylinositol N-acetylglucosaminyltransferase subunit H-like isoform X2 [Selaginella moellendorffii]|eukprot:XP_024526752.1 phosphatidylinositol N-acetylglucosaminyltransferase subunit H-like isoform X2 [Selaginella moellendorffii]